MQSYKLLKIDKLQKKLDTSQIQVCVQAYTVDNGKAAINEKTRGFEANCDCEERRTFPNSHYVSKPKLGGNILKNQ